MSLALLFLALVYVSGRLHIWFGVAVQIPLIILQWYSRQALIEEHTKNLTSQTHGVSVCRHCSITSSGGVGGVLHISHPDKVTLSESGLVCSILHISHPVKVTLWGWVGFILHISRPIKVTSSKGGGGILHISPTKLNTPQQ